MHGVFLKGACMSTAKHSDQRLFFIILTFCLGLSSGCMGTAKVETDKLYFEPPGRIIDDYTGMFQTQEVNWVWTQIGFRFSNYQTVTIKPFHLFSEVQEQGLSDKLYQGLIAWFKEAGIQLSDSGPVQVEGAVVETRLQKSFLEKYNPFNESRGDFFLEAEFIIRETSSPTTVFKIRHGVLSSDVASLPERLLADVTGYLNAYK